MATNVESIKATTPKATPKALQKLKRTEPEFPKDSIPACIWQNGR